MAVRFRFSLDYNNHNFTNALGPAAACAAATRAQTCLYPAGDSRETTATRYVGKQGLPKGYTGSFGYDGEIPLTSDITLYSYATVAHQYSQNFGIFRPAASLQTLMQVYPDATCPSSSCPPMTGNWWRVCVAPAWRAGIGILSTSISDTIAKLHNNHDLESVAGPGECAAQFPAGRHCGPGKHHQPGYLAHARYRGVRIPAQCRVRSGIPLQRVLPDGGRSRVPM